MRVIPPLELNMNHKSEHFKRYVSKDSKNRTVNVHVVAFGIEFMCRIYYLYHSVVPMHYTKEDSDDKRETQDATINIRTRSDVDRMIAVSTRFTTPSAWALIEIMITSQPLLQM
jgi:hypothetical protein